MPHNLPPLHVFNLVISLIALGYALITELRWSREPRSAWRVGPVVFQFLIVGTLFAGRWPMIVQRYELNPDESQIIAGALTLISDPVPWRSVDGMTTGPLSDYWLAVAGTVAPLDFMVARTWAVVTFGAALALTYLALRKLTSDVAARWGVAPAVCFAAFTTHHDFAHYSSEHLPVLLMAAAVYCLVEMMTNVRFRTSLAWAILAALFLGAQPWAKLQAVPIAFPIGLLGVYYWIRNPSLAPRQRLVGATGMVFASVTPSVCLAIILRSEGLLADFYDRYIGYVLEYTHSRPESAIDLLSNFTRYADLHSGITWLTGGATIWLLFAMTVTWLKRRGTPHGGLGLACVYAAAAFITCLISGRYYTHYLLLMVLPTAFCCGWWLHQVTSPLRSASTASLSYRVQYAVFFGFLILPPILHKPFIPQPSMPVQLPHADDAVSYKINQISRRGDKLAVWGWMAEYHVRTQLVQGTRDAISVNEIDENPRRDRLTRDYVADLEKNRTRFFVDAVAPGAFAYSAPEWRHDRFPVVREYIATHYQLFDDHDGVRIYLRSDPPAASRLSNLD